MGRLAVAGLLGTAMLVAGTAPPASARERPRSEPPRRGDAAPAVGDLAPDFELVTLKWLRMTEREREEVGTAATDGKGGDGAAGGAGEASDAPAPGHVRLSASWSKRPVVLVLTSYT